MTVQLTPSQQRLVDEQLATGRFSDETAVVDAALAALKEQLKRLEEAKAEVREKIEAGYQSALRGDLFDGPSTIAELHAEITQLHESAKPE